jgi:ABC-2 type transport system permease protein
MTAVGQTWYVTARLLRALVRQPWMIGVTLVQPIIWLVLFGQLFRSVVDLPGFAGGSYIEFLAPGVVVMTALFANGWSGMSLVEDIQHGVLDRFLASLVRLGALIAGSLVYQGILTTVQSVIILGLAVLMGARYGGAPAGLVVLLAGVVLLGTAFASLSNALGLLTRRGETLVVLANFAVLPAAFLSTAFMPSGLVPGWIEVVSRFNPVTWVLEASREVLAGSDAWVPVLWQMGALLLLAAICAWLATWAFRAYQRSM